MGDSSERYTVIIAFKRVDPRVSAAVWATSFAQTIDAAGDNVFTCGFASSYESIYNRVVFSTTPYFRMTDLEYNLWNHSSTLLVVIDFADLTRFRTELKHFLAQTFSHAYFPNANTLNGQLNKLIAWTIYEQPTIGDCHMLNMCMKRSLPAMPNLFDELLPATVDKEENDACMVRFRRYDSRILGCMYSTTTVQEFLDEKVAVFTNGFDNAVSRRKRIVLLKDPNFFFTPRTYSVWNESQAIVVVMKKSNYEFFMSELKQSIYRNFSMYSFTNGFFDTNVFDEGEIESSKLMRLIP